MVGDNPARSWSSHSDITWLIRGSYELHSAPLAVKERREAQHRAHEGNDENDRRAGRERRSDRFPIAAENGSETLYRRARSLSERASEKERERLQRKRERCPRVKRESNNDRGRKREWRSLLTLPKTFAPAERGKASERAQEWARRWTSKNAREKERENELVSAQRSPARISRNYVSASSSLRVACVCACVLYHSALPGVFRALRRVHSPPPHHESSARHHSVVVVVVVFLGFPVAATKAANAPSERARPDSASVVDACTAQVRPARFKVTSKKKRGPTERKSAAEWRSAECDASFLRVVSPFSCRPIYYCTCVSGYWERWRKSVVTTRLSLIWDCANIG